MEALVLIALILGAILLSACAITYLAVIGAVHLVAGVFAFILWQILPEVGLFIFACVVFAGVERWGKLEL